MNGHVRFYYPDMSVICQPNDLSETFQDQPVVIVEVLSDSTRRLDDGEKKVAYLTISSLTHYILLEQDSPVAVVYQRADEHFERHEFTNLADVIVIGSLGLTHRLTGLLRWRAHEINNTIRLCTEFLPWDGLTEPSRHKLIWTELNLCFINGILSADSACSITSHANIFRLSLVQFIPQYPHTSLRWQECCVGITTATKATIVITTISELWVASIVSSRLMHSKMRQGTSDPLI